MVSEYEVIFGEPEPPPPFQIKNYDENDLLKEVAIHEASHYVFAVLLEKMKLGFNSVNFFQISPETTDKAGNKIYPTGVVNGFAPPLPYNEITGYDEKQIEDWYSADYSRLFGILLQTIAGFTSFRVFFKEDEYFIGWPYEPNYKDKILNFTLETMPSSQINDFIVIAKRMQIIGITNNPERLQFLKDLSDTAKQIIEQEPVKRAIKLVANALLKQPGKKIEGKKLLSLKSKVSHILWGVSLLPTLKNYEKSHNAKKSSDETPI